MSQHEDMITGGRVRKSSWSSSRRCKRHPHHVLVGVCAVCLNQRLLALALELEDNELVINAAADDVITHYDVVLDGQFSPYTPTLAAAGRRTSTKQQPWKSASRLLLSDLKCFTPPAVSEDRWNKEPNGPKVKKKKHGSIGLGRSLFQNSNVSPQTGQHIVYPAAALADKNGSLQGSPRVNGIFRRIFSKDVHPPDCHPMKEVHHSVPARLDASSLLSLPRTAGDAGELHRCKLAYHSAAGGSLGVHLGRSSTIEKAPYDTAIVELSEYPDKAQMLRSNSIYSRSSSSNHSMNRYWSKASILMSSFSPRLGLKKSNH